MFKTCALLLTMALAAEPPIGSPTINWVLTSPAPDPKGPKTNIIDEHHPLFLLYQNGLTGYQHVITKATVPRIEAELKGKKLACFPGSSEAQRRKQFAYLTPQYIQPSPQLIATQKAAQYLREKYKSGLTLKEVLYDANLKGMVGEARSYGATIDAILAQGSPHVHKGVFETFGPNLLTMLEKGRADYTIEYPFIWNYLKETGQAGSQLVSLPLKDVGNFITQYLACSKTPEGLEVIRKADRIIRDNIKSAKFWNPVLETIPPADRAEFQKEIHSFVENRTKAPIIIE